MEWNVYTYDFNHGEVKTINIFDNLRLVDDISEAFREYGDDKNGFSERVRRWIMYYYWGKCEYEIIISSWPESERLPEFKIDVYDQVMINWNAFIGYVIEHKYDFMKEGEE